MNYSVSTINISVSNMKLGCACEAQQKIKMRLSLQMMVCCFTLSMTPLILDLSSEIGYFEGIFKIRIFLNDFVAVEYVIDECVRDPSPCKSLLL